MIRKITGKCFGFLLTCLQWFAFDQLNRKNTTILKLKVTLFAIVIILPLQAQANFIKYKKYLIPIGDCGTIAIPGSAPNAIDSGKARVFITTDINGGDPDDKQSLAHLLAFASEVDIEGFSTSDPNTDNSIITGKVFIQNAINNHYRNDLPKLRLQNPGKTFPEPEKINKVYLGSTTVGSANGGGWGKSDGANAIIKSVRCSYRHGDLRPLYILTWGTSSEVIRAIEQAPDIIKYIRVVSYSDHNNERNFSAVNNYLKNIASNNALWWIDFPVGYSKKPLTTCGNSTLNSLAASIKGKGNLGNIIQYNSYIECSSRHDFFKLGDTITTMFVLFNNANQRSSPNTATWGNYSKQTRVGQNYWVLPDTIYHRRSDVYTTWYNRVRNL